MTDRNTDILILGGGLTGLSAGYALTKAGLAVTVFEHDSVVGGISKTIKHDGFRFDLGPHRFFTKDAKLKAFVRDLMGDELITVPRRTMIFLRGKYFNYPLEPANAVFGMGVATTARILADYGKERVKRIFKSPEPVSLEDWVVANFGRALFDIYFKQYSEKVWGIDCTRISASWVAKRITGMSLWSAVANAFFKMNGKDIPSLVDEFLYPRKGIGRIPDTLAAGIERKGRVLTNSSVERINCSGAKVESVQVKNGAGVRTFTGMEFISSIPITKLIELMHPSPPEAVLAAARGLRFRDLVIVAVMVNRARVTDLTWVYLPEKDIPIGRVHEPVNWSADMAPPGKTVLVAEFFSFQGDAVWQSSDTALSDTAVDSLVRLGYIARTEVLDTLVLRVPRTYPLFETGYQERIDAIYEYLATFTNLHIAGRAGMFKYYNMDHAIGSGMAAAEKIMARSSTEASAKCKM